MSHRTVIFNRTVEQLNEPEVRELLTPAQCTRVDQILSGPQPCCDEDFRYLQRRVTNVYCAED